MYVIKRNGQKQPVMFDKITSRINKLVYGLSKEVDPVSISQKVVSGVYKGVKTQELDELTAQTSAYMATYHPDFSVLAGRICASNLHKTTPATFTEAMEILYNNKHNGEHAPLVSKQVYEISQKFSDQIEKMINHQNDYTYDYFAFKTIEKAYLLSTSDKRIVERPQYMIMRVSIGIHGDNLEKVEETYTLLSEKYFTHATPTLFNSGTPRPQMSSCFLISTKDDSVEGIYDTLKNCALISKYAGGIGLSIHDIRASNSYIKGTGGKSDGIIPMCQVYNNTARYINQSGRRKGSFAMYLEPHHADIFDFLELKKNHGKEESRARDLFYALWISDLFMKRVENNEHWSLMCPNTSKGLSDVYGKEYEKLYTQYEKEGKFVKQIKAQELWFKILESQIETGTPYMLYKDSVNTKSNQKNLGTIKSSNLCCEIMEYTSPDEIAVCNLASINLSKFVNDKEFDFEKLGLITKVVTRNLNKVIDLNFYPVEEAKRSNLRHRPMGIGVQGLADAFILMGFPFESEEASKLNKEIFECIYYNSLEESIELAKNEGVYETFHGSPASKGLFQFDLWKTDIKHSGKYDWESLRSKMTKYGIRNSLLLAPMPTASTAQILGNNESIEPYTSNIYTRRVLSGEFAVINKHLINDLIKLGLWNDSLRNTLMSHKGSVQNIKEIPDNIKELYKTVWEISQKKLIDMAAARGVYICQSQSFNVHISEPTFPKLTSMHFYGWKKGLKTGMYYLRSKPKANAIAFTVETKKTVETKYDIVPTGEFCTMEDGCLSCGS